DRGCPVEASRLYPMPTPEPLSAAIGCIRLTPHPPATRRMTLTVAQPCCARIVAHATVAIRDARPRSGARIARIAWTISRSSMATYGERSVKSRGVDPGVRAGGPGGLTRGAWA